MKKRTKGITEGKMKESRYELTKELRTRVQWQLRRNEEFKKNRNWN